MKKQIIKGLVFWITTFIGLVVWYFIIFAAINWTDFTNNVNIETPLTPTLWNNTMNTIKNNIESSVDSVLQTKIYSDYTIRTTVSGSYYYFWGSEFSNSITPSTANNIILISINYFWEANTHDITALLQYSINGWAWTNFDVVAWSSQQWTLKLWNYPDTDYNSTPHNNSTQVAKVFNTTLPVSFRMYHFNWWTYYHNTAVSALYESGPSTLVLEELNSWKSSYTKR